jgi:hypothetical protein
MRPIPVTLKGLPAGGAQMTGVSLRKTLKPQFPWFGLLLALALLGASAQEPGIAPLHVQFLPGHPIIELRDHAQRLNFDIAVQNSGPSTLRISQIELSVFDSNRQLVLRKSINSDAFAPSVAVIGKQLIEPGETLDIFNPFSDFDAAVPLTTLQFSFCLLRESTPQEREKNQHRLPDDCDIRQEFSVTPRTYTGKTALILPLSGKIFVWEGHDFYAHHQRVPLSNPKVQSLGITANSNDFASDFIYLDPEGKKYHDDPRTLSNWYSYAKPIYAPGSGVVLAAANDIPDNSFEDAQATKIDHPQLPPGKDPKDIGNFVLIDHQNGEYSLLIHMKPGSVTVRPADLVRQGQMLGRIGFAGDSIFPHLHYCLMDGPEVFKAWGLPAYFSHFRRMLGGTAVSVDRGPVDSGDFVESLATDYSPEPTSSALAKH